MGWPSWDDITEAASSVVEDVQDLGSDIVDAAEDFGDDIADTWNDSVNDFEQGIDEGGLVGGILGFASGVLAGIVSATGNVLDLIVSVSSAAAGDTLKVVGDIAGGVFEIFMTSVTGNADLGRSVGNGIRNTFRSVGEAIAALGSLVGDTLGRAGDWAGSFFRYTIARGNCLLQSAYNWISTLGDEPSELSGMDRVRHLFVLVLENRSFDHMLGQSNLKAIWKFDEKSPSNRLEGIDIAPGGAAKLQLDADPPHEFPQVQEQLSLDGVPMSGFVRTFRDSMVPQGVANLPEDPAEVMRGFPFARLPVLQTLAAEFCVLDHWFSALPGPTVPNRLFFHAATSGGLADSPSTGGTMWNYTFAGFDFEHGTVFDKLTAKCVDWAVYAGDATPQVLLLEAIAIQAAVSGLRRQRMRAMDDLAADLAVAADDDFPGYIFLEPDYGRWWSDFHDGQSQHPRDTVAGGEALIRYIYEALVKSPIWNSSALLITYDEHGGFYDHVRPPEGVSPPGDEPRYREAGADPSSRSFAFDRLGVRVPAILVSPLVERGAVDREQHEHSSVVRALHDIFGISTLTKRGDEARSLAGLFRRARVRGDAPQLPDPVWNVNP